MWDKLSKLPIQIVVSILVVLLSFGLLYLLPFKEIPTNNKDVFNTLIGVVIGSSLTPVLGWLYTMSKGTKQNEPTK